MKSVEMPPIRNHVELSYRIMKLNALKAEQEEVIKRNLKEIYFSFHPSELIRKAWSNFKENPEAQQTVSSAGIGMGLDFLVRKLTGRNTSLKGYLFSVLFEKAATHLINKHSDKIAGGIAQLGKLFGKKEQ